MRSKLLILIEPEQPWVEGKLGIKMLSTHRHTETYAPYAHGCTGQIDEVQATELE